NRSGLRVQEITVRQSIAREPFHGCIHVSAIKTEGASAANLHLRPLDPRDAQTYVGHAGFDACRNNEVHAVDIVHRWPAERVEHFCRLPADGHADRRSSLMELSLLKRRETGIVSGMG